MTEFEDWTESSTGDRKALPGRPPAHRGKSDPAEKATSLEVAERAGVSRSAVSRTFTPGASVSKKTAEKVRLAAEELGYRPNMLARSLMTGRSRIIGLVAAYLDNQFYPAALEKLTHVLQAKGYHVLMFMASQKAGNIDTVLEQILDYQVDGLILASIAASSDLAERCRAADVPVVLFNRRDENALRNSVTSDNFEGGRLAAELLVAGDHRRIAHIAGWLGASTARDREAGFRAGLAEAGLSLAAHGAAEFDPERARSLAREMFAGPDRADSVFVATDNMAIKVMDTLRYEIGLRVPEDVSVIGFDDVPAAAWPSYDLTTIRQDPDALAGETVRLLLRAIELQDGQDEQVVLPVEPVIRGSAKLLYRK